MTLDEAIKRFEALAESYESYVESINPKEFAEWLTELKERRAADVKRGKWLNSHYIWIEQPEIEGYFVQAECSECGRWAHEMNPYTKFIEYEKCPHCGVEMST